MSTRLLIVDDHPIMRDALVTSLRSLNLFSEVETLGSFQGLLDKLQSDADYQLLILDLSLTDISGADGMIFVREHYADIPIVIFSGNDSADIISECFEKGVHAFVSKNSSMPVLMKAIKLVLNGGIYIPPMANAILALEPVAEGDSSAPETTERLTFTPKQYEVFQQLMLGVPNKIIGRRLNMAEGTVKAHLHSIYQLLRVSNRAQAILRSQQIQIDSSATKI